jgi:hypothetical protein
MCEIGHIYLKGMIPNTELTQPATLVIKATQVNTIMNFLMATALSSQWTKKFQQKCTNFFFSLKETRDRTETVLDTSLLDSFQQTSLLISIHLFITFAVYMLKETYFVPFFNCFLYVFLPPCIIQ